MKSKAGFTLIEVLIALVILSIALTAIIKSTSQNIKDTLYVQKKTIALWVGNQVMNEIIAGLRPPPTDILKDKMKMLNETWDWEASLKPTPNPHIQEINVDVSQGTPLIHLVSYLYAQQ